MGNKAGAERLAYSREGSGSTVVFLHGLGASQAQAQAILGALPDVERIAIDAPGHGGSAHSKVDFNFGAFATAVVELLDHLGIASAIFGGISMGAGISLRIARDYPERVEALVLVRPAWLDGPGRPHLDIVADLGEWIAVEGFDAARERLMTDSRYLHMCEHATLSAASVANAIDAIAASGRPEVLGAMVDSQPIADISELASITQRALVIATEHDALHPTGIAHDLATNLPNASSLLSPPRYLEPEAHQGFVAQAVNSFIANGHG